MTSTDLPRLLELIGTPAQMGAEHGEQARSEIRALAAERVSIILAASPLVNLNLIEQVSRHVLAQTAHLAPEIFEESASTAKVCGLEHWELLVAGGFSDIFDRCTKLVGSSNPRSDCTLWPATAADGSVRLAGTWDTHASGQTSLVLVHRRPSAGCETLALSSAGWPMQQGITSNGVAFAIANMGASSDVDGTSYICSLPRVVNDATTAGGAVDAAGLIPLCSARYFAFCDALGGFAGAETDGRRFWASSKKIAHTNHFIIEAALHSEGRPTVVPDSERRRQSAEFNLERKADNARELLDLLAFHDGTAASISRYGTEREDRTCAAFVLDPTRRRITYTPGPPADHEPREAELP